MTSCVSHIDFQPSTTTTICSVILHVSHCQRSCDLYGDGIRIFRDRSKLGVAYIVTSVLALAHMKLKTTNLVLLGSGLRTTPDRLKQE